MALTLHKDTQVQKVVDTATGSGSKTTLCILQLSALQTVIIKDETPKTSVNIILSYNWTGLRYSEMRIKSPLRMTSFEVDFGI